MRNYQAQYYHRLSGGQYQCLICQKVTPHRIEAYNCCQDKKPAGEQLIKHAQAILLTKPKYKRLTPRTARPGDNILVKDRWGHWHRAKKITGAKIKADYHKAFAHLDKEQIKELERMFIPSDEEYLRQINRKPPRTALQRLAWAYYNHNWDQVKEAAYQLAYEVAGSNKLDKWREELTTDDILCQLQSYLRGDNNDQD